LAILADNQHAERLADCDVFNGLKSLKMAGLA